MTVSWVVRYFVFLRRLFVPQHTRSTCVPRRKRYFSRSVYRCRGITFPVSCSLFERHFPPEASSPRCRNYHGVPRRHFAIRVRSFIQYEILGEERSLIWVFSLEISSSKIVANAKALLERATRDITI